MQILQKLFRPSRAISFASQQYTFLHRARQFSSTHDLGLPITDLQRLYLHEDKILRYLSSPQRPHALLFVGPDGCGKSTLLQYMRHAINTDRAHTHTPSRSQPIHIRRYMQLLETFPHLRRGLDRLIFDTAPLSVADMHHGNNHDADNEDDDGDDDGDDDEEYEGETEAERLERRRLNAQVREARKDAKKPVSTLSEAIRQRIANDDLLFLAPPSEQELEQMHVRARSLLKKADVQARTPFVVSLDWSIHSHALSHQSKEPQSFQQFLDETENSICAQLACLQPPVEILHKSLSSVTSSKFEGQHIIDAVQFLRGLESKQRSGLSRSGIFVMRFLFRLMQNLSLDDKRKVYPALFISNFDVILKHPSWGKAAMDYHDWILLRFDENINAQSFPLVMTSNNAQHSLWMPDEFGLQDRIGYVPLYPLSQSELQDIPFIRQLATTDFLYAHERFGGNVSIWRRLIEKANQSPTSITFRQCVDEVQEQEQWPKFVSQMKHAYELYKNSSSQPPVIPTVPYGLSAVAPSPAFAVGVASEKSSGGSKSTLLEFEFLDFLEKVQDIDYTFDYGLAPAEEVLEHRVFKALVDAQVYTVNPIAAWAFPQTPVSFAFLDRFIKSRKDNLSFLESVGYVAYRAFWGLPSLKLLMPAEKIPY